MEINEIYKKQTLYFSPVELNEKYGISFIFTSAFNENPEGKPDDFNLSLNTEDEPVRVLKNREKILYLNDIKTLNPIIFLKQTHSARTVIIDEDFLQKFRKLYIKLSESIQSETDIQEINKIKNSIPSGDAIITAMPGIPIMVLGADCNIILVCDINLRIIAAIHSGWRGVLNNILGNSLNMMIERFGCKRKDLMLFFGPSIRKCCFETDRSLYEDFKKRFGEIPGENNKSYIKDKYFIDLVEILKYEAIKTGIEVKNISIIDKCTSCCKDGLFFSYRKNKKTGRQAALAYIRDNFKN